MRGGDAHRAIDAGADLRGHGGGDDVFGDVREQILEVDLLLVGGTERLAALLPNNGDHRHVISLGVVEASQQVDRAGAGGGVAKPDLASKFSVGRGHEGRHLLVAHLHVVHVALGLL